VKRPAEVLRTARRALGLNQTELAERTGISQSYISLFESGREIPVKQAIALGEALGVLPADLLEEEVREVARAINEALLAEEAAKVRSATKKLYTAMIFNAVERGDLAGAQRVLARLDEYVKEHRRPDAGQRQS
jgi:transcriptional regulator with XRE-family HTH domain